MLIISYVSIFHELDQYALSKRLCAYEIAERIEDSVEIVLQVYGHMFPNPQKNIVNVLNNNFNFEYQYKIQALGQKLGQEFFGHEKSSHE